MSAGSFTQRVVAEVAPHTPPTLCCRAALIAGMLDAAGFDGTAPSSSAMTIYTTRLVAARAALHALHALEVVTAHVERIRAPRRIGYSVDAHASTVQPSERLCCARSRLRGAFLVGGRVNRPESAVHVEITCADEAGGQNLAAAASALGIPTRAVQRRGRVVLVVRSADGVASVLSSIGAQTGRLDFEGGRVVHEVRGSVNRALNAETGNLRRRVGAGVRQVAAIRALMADPQRWAELPAALREAAALRLRLPQEPLERLADEAAISRSAMAGRLRRLEEFAERA